MPNLLNLLNYSKLLTRNFFFCFPSRMFWLDRIFSLVQEASPRALGVVLRLEGIRLPNGNDWSVLFQLIWREVLRLWKIFWERVQNIFKNSSSDFGQSQHNAFFDFFRKEDRLPLTTPLAKHSLSQTKFIRFLHREAVLYPGIIKGFNLKTCHFFGSSRNSDFFSKKCSMFGKYCRVTFVSSVLNFQYILFYSFSLFQVGIKLKIKAHIITLYNLFVLT